MRYLIDTHVFLWMVDKYENLSEKVKYILLDTDNELYFSKVSYWEICVKQSIGKLKLESGWQRRFEREIQENQIRWIEVEKNHCEGLIELPWKHRDPFDRLLVSQAKCEVLSILTKDENINKYEVQTVW